MEGLAQGCDWGKMTDDLTNFFKFQVSARYVIMKACHFSLWKNVYLYYIISIVFDTHMI